MLPEEIAEATYQYYFVGLSAKEIAMKYGISDSTVLKHIRIYTQENHVVFNSSGTTRAVG